MRVVALALASILLSLVAVEVVVRLFLFRPTAIAQWSDRPEFYYSHEGAEFLRDASYSAEKPTGTFRIAVVGDSFSFAPYMQFDDTFPKRLERMLNLRVSQPRVEVLNYGVPRYSTNHEIALVERAVREKADLILLQITLNDPEIKPYRPTGLVADQVNRFGQLELTGPLYSYWKTAAFVRTRLFNLESRQKYVDYFRDLFTDQATLKNFTGSLDAIVARANAGQVPIAAVVFPLFGLPLDDQYPFRSIHDQVAAIVNARKLPSLDLYSAYAGIPIERLQVIPGQDFHPNEIGHRIAAEHLYTWLITQKLVPEDVVNRALYKERIDIRRPEQPTYSIGSATPAMQ